MFLFNFKGKDVHVNPSAEQKLQRDLQRCERLKLKMDEMIERGQGASKRFESFNDEYTFRMLRIKRELQREGG